MAADAKQLLAQALTLPSDSRAALAADLIESLDDGDPPDEVEAAWAEEIRERLAQVDAGEVKTIPWSEARRRILAAAGVSDETR